MSDLEKVIKGLKMHKTGLCNVLTASGKEYCPYWENNDNCMLELLNDSLSLLKEQEPRVMTLEEVKALPCDTDIWIETEYYVGKFTIFAATINTKGLRGVMVYGTHKTYYYEAYNKLWRCWSARPTEEDREKVKWYGE